MNTCIYYASRSGNTRKIAEAMADALHARGLVRVHALEGSPPSVPADADLVIVGGPTEGHGATPAVTAFLDGIPAGALRDRAVAAFDTRLDWPKWLSGSAASVIGARLESLGARLIAPPQSFIVSTKPELAPGELQRAGLWAGSLPEPAAVDPVTVAAAR
jgi:flavodoxin